MGQNIIEFEEPIVHETPRAILMLDIAGGNAWIPKSQMIDMEINTERTMVSFSMEQWKAEKNGLV